MTDPYGFHRWLAQQWTHGFTGAPRVPRPRYCEGGGQIVGMSCVARFGGEEVPVSHVLCSPMAPVPGSAPCQGIAILPSPTLRDKHERLQAALRDLRSVAVAFSAGVDSTLVLKVAHDVLGAERVVAVTGRSASVPAAELVEARELAERIGVEHQFLDTDEFSNADYLKNPTNRCYFCKSTLYTHLERFLSDRGLHAAVNGTNADDLGDYRPGLRAADEFHVRSPLAEVGLTKAEVRELSHELGLSTHDKPASPCLSSRVPYGDAITPEKLRMIEAAERFLHELGIRECRVRHHDTLARIEVPPETFDRIAENRARIDSHFLSLGYESVTLDPRGFRSGSLNELITLGVNASAARA